MRGQERSYAAQWQLHPLLCLTRTILAKFNIISCFLEIYLPRKKTCYTVHVHCTTYLSCFVFDDSWFLHSGCDQSPAPRGGGRREQKTAARGFAKFFLLVLWDRTVRRCSGGYKRRDLAQPTAILLCEYGDSLVRAFVFEGSDTSDYSIQLLRQVYLRFKQVLRKVYLRFKQLLRKVYLRFNSF